MSQRSVELLIGRLVTDEAFRRSFLRAPNDVAAELGRAGHHLSPIEIAAVTATDPDVWDRAAAGLDARLLKVGR